MRYATIFRATLCVIAAVASFQARANWGPITAHVTLIDADGMGARVGDTLVPILFNIDTGNALSGNPCGTTGGAQANLLFVPPNFVNASGDEAHPTGNDRQMVNSRAALSQLQVALATGYRVKIWGYSGTGGYCQVYIIQLLNN